MTDFSSLLQQGAGNAWLFIPSAILLGALHGLEPGHSKTMMAAFIVAIRGTVGQAILLGLSATLSHTAVVWLVALAGLTLGSQWNMETAEPYFQLASSALIIAIALWMAGRTWRHSLAQQSHHRAHGSAEGAANHRHEHAQDTHAHQHERGAAADFAEGSDCAYQDPHERAHADDIRHRFAHREVTNGQILMFGLTGGLIPCPAAITVLLLCLQLKKMALGASLVLCFSIGLALTMVFSGVIAAISVRHAARRWSGFGEVARKAPYFSSTLIVLIGLYVGYHGWIALP